MKTNLPLVAVTGLGRGESPQPGAAVVTSLRRRWPDLRIAGLAYDAMESGAYAPGHPEITFTIPYPSCGVQVFLNRLDEVREIFPFDVLIPTLDAEMEPLMSLRAQLDRRGIRCLLPDRTAFKSRRKENLEDLAMAAGVKTPRTFGAHDAAAAAAHAAILGRVMVKGVFYEAMRADSPAQARACAGQLLAEWGGPVLVQELIEGSEYDVLAVGDGEGGMLGSCAIRKLVVSSRGKGYAGMTVRDAALTEQVKSLMQELRWRGPAEFEFLRDSRGEYYLIEINPRFPAWADFPAALGCNLAAAAIQQALGWPVESLPAIPPGKVYLRHSTDIVCDAEDLGRLTSEGQTLLHPAKS